MSAFLGQFLSEQERHEEAAEVYLTAVKLSPSDYEIIFNTANTLRQVILNFFKGCIKFLI
jgi:cytochrome c-type biogenesis protein CcmH/NrfG